MYYIKKIFLLAVVVITGLSAHAQFLDISLKGGLTLAKLDYVDQTYQISSLKPGITIGAYGEKMVRRFIVQLGMSYANKGGKVQYDDIKEKLALSYLEVPLNVSYIIHASEKLIYVGAGAYYAHALSGRISISSGKTTIEQKLDFGNGEEELKSNDLGVNLLAGARLLNKYDVSATFSLSGGSLGNTAANQLKNRVISIKLGYYFNTKNNPSGGFSRPR